MFQKEKFSGILKKILINYDSIQDFANHAEMDRGYLSRNINKKLDNPPTPKILKKIADSSQGIVTYSELMKICGYIEEIQSYEDYASTRLKELKPELLSLEENFSNLNLNEEEQELLENYKTQKENLKNEYSNLSNSDKNYQDMKATDDWYSSENDKLLDSVLHNNSKNIRKDVIKKALKILSEIEHKKYLLDDYEKIKNEMAAEDSAPYSNSNVVKIPVVGTVAAGTPILAEQNIIDYEELPANEFKDGEYFGLKVKGNSMFPRILERDVVIVRRQDDCESGQIAVVLINGDEATVKQVKKTDSGIMLIPYNTNEYEPMFFTKEDIEKKPVKVIGIVKRLIGYNFD